MTVVGLPALDVANAYVEIDQIIMVTVAVIVAFSALFVLINSSRRFLAVIVGVIWIGLSLPGLLLFRSDFKVLPTVAFLTVLATLGTGWLTTLFWNRDQRHLKVRIPRA